MDSENVIEGLVIGISAAGALTFLKFCGALLLEYRFRKDLYYQMKHLVGFHRNDFFEIRVPNFTSRTIRIQSLSIRVTKKNEDFDSVIHYQLQPKSDQKCTLNYFGPSIESTGNGWDGTDEPVIIEQLCGKVFRMPDQGLLIPSDDTKVLRLSITVSFNSVFGTIEQITVLSYGDDIGQLGENWKNAQKELRSKPK
jgi:hypothetical protein